MACCGKKRAANPQPFSVMGGYDYLTDSQIKARLEVFKRMYCKACSTRYNCDFGSYKVCTIRPQNN